MAPVPPRVASALFVAAASTAAGVYFATQLHFAYPAPVRKPWADALAINLVYYWAWGAAVPIVVALARRFPFEQGRQARSVIAHLLAAAVVTVIQLAAAAFTLGLTGFTASPGLRYVARGIATNFHSSFPTYFLILFVALTLDYQARYRERQLRAAQLEARLGEARLAALRLQLNPHFLFNTLNSISALMYTDVDAADAMMQKLGDLLRLSLEEGRGPEIPLREELALVERYLDIERVRFDDRLHVRFDVEEAALEGRVPAFALQPLVENAVRHAITPRPEGGCVEIAARRVDDDLQVSVTDDGPGLPEGRLVTGVGLANTRARLDQLYGKADALALVPLKGRGLRVLLTIPFHTA
jgi:two-component system, LytTR family, sensor kinase